MTAATEPAHAKLNLALHVRGRRPSPVSAPGTGGYHDIETLFAFCEHGDVLRAEPADGLSLTIDGPFSAGLSAGEDNLVMRAVRLLAEEAGLEARARLSLDKRLPVASGIGGGSADAAAALRLVNRLWNLDWTTTRLAKLAVSLGADVPACVHSRTMRGSGKGERLIAMDAAPLSGLPVLLVNPGVKVSTAAVFAAWDGIDRGGLSKGAPMEMARDGRNDLTSPATAIAPSIKNVLNVLQATDGTMLTRMSGSGATCFALYENAAARDRAAAAVAAANPLWWHMATLLR